MEAVFHEKQEGSLCAQHCLNSLLQGQFYSPLDLSEVGMELDTMERLRMAENGEDSPEYIQFIQQPSANMDDSGFFSVQVIAKCLEVWGLELINYNSNDERAVRTRAAPISASAYICNYREHWFTIRRLGSQWFNLNSLLEFPELISNSYLREFLAQLQTEGYTIFLVVGTLPDCDADLVLQAVPAVQSVRPRLLSEIQGSGSSGQGSGGGRGGLGSGTSGRDEEADIEAALALSLAENVAAPGGGPARIDDLELQRALGRAQQAPIDEELEMALNMSRSMETEPSQPDVSEEDEMQQAIAASLEGGSSVVSQGGGGGLVAGWGDRLRRQEVEEEQKWKLEDEKKRREEEEEQKQLEEALAMSMQVDEEEAKVKPPPKAGPSKAAATPKVDPVQTAWPKLKNPPPGSVSSNSPAPAATSPGGSAPRPGGSAQPPRPDLKKYMTGKEEETAEKEAEKRPLGPGHALGGGPSSARGRGSRGGAEADPADPQEIRRRRMAFLDKLQKSPPEKKE